ncbi:MAG: Glu-tRNA(Gln) amidotransferase subunit GatE [Candidatus Aenigmarchaeota archaeon]|nr:Glu-tRNA(Gln) amidotransferase subunit GatE [Candidatus Aenigmarchaeota archaeon]
MADVDYSKLGLRVGLEIHQQLATRHKLFCKCPLKKSAEFPLHLRRKLRVVPSELGEYDPAALYEYLRNRTFIYSWNRESSCLVELDEDPPKLLNEEALHLTMQICKMLGCSVLDELHVMRKTVIDGSSVSGFQRTVLVGIGGEIETSLGRIGISRVSLEEDSAPAISRKDDTIEYRLDRLGVPLVEIATEPDIRSPEQAREAAAAIGTLLRSTKVMRGIGSIRQDINISIETGARIEVKGFQELEKISALVANEVARQLSLLEIKDELKRRGVRDVKAAPSDVTAVFAKTRNNFLRRMLNEGARIFAMTLPGFAGLMTRQCGDRTFGKELAGYAEAYGHGIIQGDEDLKKYELLGEFVSLRKQLNAGERDVILISAGRDPAKALSAVSERAALCVTGVPEETRIADGDGSKYTRPLPGAERMYPESDIPAAAVSRELLQAITLPKTLAEKKQELEKELPKELAHQLVDSRYYGLYMELKEKYRIEPVTIASVFVNTLTDLRRRGCDVEKITDEHFEKIFALVAEGRIAKKSVAAILEELCGGAALEKAAEKYHVVTDKYLKEIIRSVIREKPGLSQPAYMGLIMERVRGRADGGKIAKMLREELA